MMERPNENENRHVVPRTNLQHLAEPTLLPPHIANAVSLVTRSTSLSLRIGTLIGGLAFDGARTVTLTGLEVSRSVLEGILRGAGHDVASRASGDLGRLEAKGILDKSIATLHSTITNISFAASTGFSLSAAVLGSATDVSQQLLAVLDSILGSTDSSRAISSIITLIRREFQNPATGREGEKVGVTDLVLGMCALLMLQRWCQKFIDAERRTKCDQVIWDVVVLDNGARADVMESIENSGLTKVDSASTMTALKQIGHKTNTESEDSDEDLPEIRLKHSILRSLPDDASISITTSTTTTKTVTVEIVGAELPDMITPPGVEIVEESAHHAISLRHDDEDMPSQSKALIPPLKHRVVFRIMKNSAQESEVRGLGEAIETLEGERGKNGAEDLDTQAAVPPTPDNTGAEDADEFVLVQKTGLAQSVDRMEAWMNEQPVHAPQPISKDLKHAMNQRKPRQPSSAHSPIGGFSEKAAHRKSQDGPLLEKPAKRSKITRPDVKPSKEKVSFRNALKKGSGTSLASLWGKDAQPAASSRSESIQHLAADPKRSTPVRHSQALPHVTQSNSSTAISRIPKVPQRGSSAKSPVLPPTDIPRSLSRTSYYSVHEQRRDSIVSQTDTYSLHSTDNRPGSPTALRTQTKTQSSLLRVRSEKNVIIQPRNPTTTHRRSTSHVPSIYTLRTNDSMSSLVLACQPRRSTFDGSENMDMLIRTGCLEGMFPQHHIIRNMSHFVRFASASYGASFLRIMGIPSESAATHEIDISHHHEHDSFSKHTQLPANTILLSSHVDPQGGTDSSGQTNTGIPMVHFVSLDHESKAVVLTCRGTLGFEDVLTDMTCDYDIVHYRGKNYSVHKGIHASAQRLLDGKGSKVMATIKAALEEFPSYGLVLCGHSLGGGVTALLAVLISEPHPDLSASSFVTSSFSDSKSPIMRLPPGRPIHVYAYGPPATFSPSLRLATRGLITTIVNGQDLVPYLSLGVLHDLQAVALALKTDDSGAKGEVRKRVWAGVKDTFADQWYHNLGDRELRCDHDDQWAYAALKSLRASMLSAKLLPPGEVFVVETTPVLQRYAFTSDGQVEGGTFSLGRPATRSVLRYIRDVEKRFGELQFGGSMLLDHSPGRYERSLGALRKGVLG